MKLIAGTPEADNYIIIVDNKKIIKYYIEAEDGLNGWVKIPDLTSPITDPNAEEVSFNTKLIKGSIQFRKIS